MLFIIPIHHMHLCLFEDTGVPHLLPLVYTRPVYGLRPGLRTQAEALQAAFGDPPLLLHTRPELAAVTAQAYPEVNRFTPGDAPDTLFVNGRYVPEPGAAYEALRAAAQPGAAARVLVQDQVVLAARVPAGPPLPPLPALLTPDVFAGLPVETVAGARLIDRLWDLLTDLPAALARDQGAFPLGVHTGADVQPGALLAHGHNIHLAPGAVVRPGALLNAEDGPIIIDTEAVVMEGAILRGPCYLGPHAQAKMAARLDTALIGPWCKAGGEIHESIMHGYANKGHDGYLGNSYIAPWCNLGADTNNSNLKNDYGKVSLYSTAKGTFEDSGQQFLGLIMADHAKCGINTMFNTGTVVGVFCNLFGAGYMPRHAPSFSWGGADGLRTYHLRKACQVATAVMRRRQVDFTEADRALLTHIFEATAGQRAQG